MLKSWQSMRNFGGWACYNVDALYRDFTDKQITVGEIVELLTGRVFNFADDEANYFAVMEKK
ncbi:hypothetical protein ABIE48_002743 [Paenibacillus sp. OAE614]